jgi:hypothetical protein
MRLLPLVLLAAACSSTLTTFDDKVTPPNDGFDTGGSTGDDDPTGDDDDDTTTAGDDDDDDGSTIITGDDDDDTVTTPPNTDPVADAGPDQIVPVGQTVYLDGSASYDDDGDVLEFDWELLSVPQVAGTVGFLDTDSEHPYFVAQWPGEYVAELVVDDGTSSSLDEVLVTAEEPNEVPVANAGVTQRVTVGTIVVLDGSASYDPNTPPDPLTYQWIMSSTPAGSSAVISNITSVSPTFTADRVGTFEIGLIVNDGTSDSDPAYVRIISEAPPSTNSGDSCFSCAQANLELERRLTAGDAAGGFGLVMLPLLVLFLQRRDEE